MKEKLYLVFGVAVALSLVIGTALLTWGKSMDWAANGLTAKATMFTAEAPRLASMGEMWKGVAIFSQSVPSVLAWGSVFVIALGTAIAIVLFSHSISRVHIERNKYLVTSGTVLEKKLLGRGTPIHSLPFPVASRLSSPDTDNGSLEGDDPDQPDQELYISPIHAQQRIVSFTG